MATAPFILASASPRRRQLLTESGYLFEVIPADIDEDSYPRGMLPAELAGKLAMHKARPVAQQHPNRVVLAADTVVAFGDLPLGKPHDPVDARNMLDLLSGTTQIVITGVALILKVHNIERAATVMSAVRMRILTPKEINRYVESGEWVGKAGGYGIQDNDPFVTRMAGSLTNIVGLPMEATKRLLAEVGITPASS